MFDRTMGTTLILLLIAASFTGCAVSKAPPEADTLAKQMQPVADKAVIYLFRNEPYSAPIPIRVSLDGRDMGSTGAETYFRWTVEPGRHMLISHSENEHGLILDTTAGQVYYVWQDVSMGLFNARTTLREVDRMTAEIALRSCYLLESRG